MDKSKETHQSESEDFFFGLKAKGKGKHCNFKAALRAELAPQKTSKPTLQTNYDVLHY